YAHLSGYEDGIQVGQVVKPGDVLGRVGSTGYGPPGTSGKFPPHLHYGMYKYNGVRERSFDPYPYLQKWEQMARQGRKRPYRIRPFKLNFFLLLFSLHKRYWHLIRPK